MVRVIIEIGGGEKKLKRARSQRKKASAIQKCLWGFQSEKTKKQPINILFRVSTTKT